MDELQKIFRAARKFRAGMLHVSATADKALKSSPNGVKFIMLCLSRHLIGDWGDISTDEKEANDQNVAILRGRLVSVYNIPKEFSAYMPKGLGDVLVVTEGDRSETLIMFYKEWEDADVKQTIGNNLHNFN